MHLRQDLQLLPCDPFREQWQERDQYRRRTTDSSDRKNLALLYEAGTLNSRMVKVLLDLDSSRTSRILADLVDRGLLVKTSQSQRGPGVTYGPGPDLPKKGRTPRTKPVPVESDEPASIQGDLFQREADDGVPEHE